MDRCPVEPKSVSKEKKEKIEIPKDKRKYFLLAGIIVALIIVLSAVTIATQRTSFFGRASGPAGGGVVPAILSRENSYVFASPISAPADGTSAIRVTVFILNNQGLGVGGQEVNLSVIPDTSVSKVQSETDNFGRALFDLTSTVPSDYKISAQVAGVTLPQTVSVAFH